jgi:hypothetical protein
MDVVQAACDLVDLILHWRVWACAAAGLAFAFALDWLFPGYLSPWTHIALPIAGFAVGLIWEWIR